MLDFDPGLAVPKGAGLYAQAGGGVDADVFIGGYTIAATSVPASVPRQGGGGKPDAPNEPRRE